MSERQLAYEVKKELVPVDLEGLTISQLVEIQKQWLVENEDFAKKLFLLPGHMSSGMIEVGGRGISFFERERVHVFGWTLPRWDQKHCKVSGTGWIQEEYLAVSLGNWFEDPKASRMIAFRAWNTLYSTQLPGHQFFVPGEWMDIVSPSIGAVINIMAKSAEKTTREKRQELIDLLCLKEGV